MRERHFLCLPVIVLCWVCFLGWPVAGQAANPQFNPGVQVGTLDPGHLFELSGISVSHSTAGRIFGHNDSPEDPNDPVENLFWEFTPGGTVRQGYRLVGALNKDWEDMSLGPGPVAGTDYLYFGDIGDNYLARTAVVIYRVAEPTPPDPNQAPSITLINDYDTINLQYPGGARDADTLMMDPVNGDLYIVSREANSKVYRAAAAQLVNGATVTMEMKASLPSSWYSSTTAGRPTAGNISPDGSEILIRSYTKASLWTRPPGTNLWDVFANEGVSVPIVATEPHGEAIDFDKDGIGYYTISELQGTASQPIYYYSRVLAVTDVRVSSTAWTSAFLDLLGSTGYSIPVGSDEQLTTLAWGNINQIQIVFCKDVVVSESDLLLTGIKVAEYAFSDFSYDAGTFTATWTLSARIGMDKLLIHLADSVQDSAGNALDGEWTDGSSTYPSGDGTSGGDFEFHFHVLPADGTGDGQVTMPDFNLIAVNYLATGKTWQEGDYTGDGVVNMKDFQLLSTNYLSKIDDVGGSGSE